MTMRRPYTSCETIQALKMLSWHGQVPSLVIAHLKPGAEEDAVKEGRMGLQPYPGPLKYPYMHSFLATFAGMLG